MAHEKDDVWGSTARRTLAFGRTTRPLTRGGMQAGRISGADLPTTFLAEGGAGDPHGPEAVERAREMAYDLTTRIQQESPYIHEEVVEHKVHDYRLYVGMWVVAGISGVSAFLTYSLWHALITVVALLFALTSSPGRQYED